MRSTQNQTQSLVDINNETLEQFNTRLQNLAFIMMRDLIEKKRSHRDLNTLMNHAQQGFADQSNYNVVHFVHLLLHNLETDVLDDAHYNKTRGPMKSDLVIEALAFFKTPGLIERMPIDYAARYFVMRMRLEQVTRKGIRSNVGKARLARLEELDNFVRGAPNARYKNILQDRGKEIVGEFEKWRHHIHVGIQHAHNGEDFDEIKTAGARGDKGSTTFALLDEFLNLPQVKQHRGQHGELPAHKKTALYSDQQEAPTEVPQTPGSIVGVMGQVKGAVKMIERISKTRFLVMVEDNHEGHDHALRIMDIATDPVTLMTVNVFNSALNQPNEREKLTHCHVIGDDVWYVLVQPSLGKTLLCRVTGLTGGDFSQVTTEIMAECPAKVICLSDKEYTFEFEDDTQQSFTLIQVAMEGYGSFQYLYPIDRQFYDDGDTRGGIKYFDLAQLVGHNIVKTKEWMIYPTKNNHLAFYDLQSGSFSLHDCLRENESLTDGVKVTKAHAVIVTSLGRMLLLTVDAVKKSATFEEVDDSHDARVVALTPYKKLGYLSLDEAGVLKNWRGTQCTGKFQLLTEVEEATFVQGENNQFIVYSFRGQLHAFNIAHALAQMEVVEYLDGSEDEQEEGDLPGTSPWNAGFIPQIGGEDFGLESSFRENDGVSRDNDEFARGNEGVPPQQDQSAAAVEPLYVVDMGDVEDQGNKCVLQ